MTMFIREDKVNTNSCYFSMFEISFQINKVTCDTIEGDFILLLPNISVAIWCLIKTECIGEELWCKRIKKYETK